MSRPEAEPNGWTMPASTMSAFSDASDLEVALRGVGDVHLIVTGRGEFRARVTHVELQRLRLWAVDERASRIGFLMVPSDVLLALFPIGDQSLADLERNQPQQGGNSDLRTRQRSAHADRRTKPLGRCFTARGRVQGVFQPADGSGSHHAASRPAMASIGGRLQALHAASCCRHPRRGDAAADDRRFGGGPRHGTAVDPFPGRVPVWRLR